MPPPPASTATMDPAAVAPCAYARASFWRRLFAFSGPGYLVAVGYMDPGNWATDLAAGSRFGYLLVSVIILANLMALLLQSLSARLGIATGMNLARACREHYSPGTRILLWLLAEGAIIACELAEVIGTGIALRLLFGIPLAIGVCLTALTVPLVGLIERRGARWLEAFTIALMLVVAACLAAELFLSRPDWGAVFSNVAPDPRILADPLAAYLAIGILGATVMPHNLYLHSAMVGHHAECGEAERRTAIRFSMADSAIALTLAMLVNAAILIVAAATFHAAGRTEVAEISEAYRLLAPMLGTGLAALLFGTALLASGQNSVITGAIAGQVVMEGFTDWRAPVWLRRTVTRAIAIVPAVIVAAWAGEHGVTRLLVMSQVVLSLQLPFAVVPLVRLTGDRATMKALVAPPAMRVAAWIVAAAIIALNATLLVQLAIGSPSM